MDKTYGQEILSGCTVVRKKFEGYLDSVTSLTFNTIKTKLIMHFIVPDICNQNEGLI